MTTTPSIETEIEFHRAWQANDPPPTVTIDRAKLWQLYDRQVRALRDVGAMLGYDIRITKQER